MFYKASVRVNSNLVVCQVGVLAGTRLLPIGPNGSKRRDKGLILK